MKLTEYIDTHHTGNKAAFARSQGVHAQTVHKWINAGFIVVEGVIYSPRRDIIKDSEQ